MLTRKLSLLVLSGLALGAVLSSVLYGATPPPGVDLVQYTTEPCGKAQAGFLVVSALQSKDSKASVEPYFPQPGDILVYDNFSKILSVAFKMIGTDTPIHAAIIVARPDGSPAILEVGRNSRPQAFTNIYIVDVWHRLKDYQGGIMIRRPRHPISPECSAALTKFALEQEGKPFAVGRLCLQGTPFRCRYGLRKYLFAETIYDRRRWICSENVVVAATIAGLLDPHVHFANCMYPRDLAFDEHYDLSATYGDARVWVPTPNHVTGISVEMKTK